MPTKVEKLNSYIIRCCSLDSLTFYETRMNVPRSVIRARAKYLRTKYEYVFVAKIDESI